ncbi:MAG: hypothetical protein GF401_05015 [Chitinivibrionales bacterium]|nr:hypothetical protein [Chitinivibrionales bacterium]
MLKIAARYGSIALMLLIHSGSAYAEDCIGFDPGNIEVTQNNGRWKIAEGATLLLDFDTNEAEAQKAYVIIQEYGFDQICYVGRPDASMVYFRKDAGTPVLRTNHQSAPGFTLITNRVGLIVNLPEPSAATLTVTNLRGERITRIDGNFAGRVTIPSDNFHSAGLYVITVEIGAKTFVRKTALPF